MAIRIGHMEIALAPRGVLRSVWMKALLRKIRPATVNVRDVKNQPPPLEARLALFEV
jgi:hypothetical protein